MRKRQQIRGRAVRQANAWGRRGYSLAELMITMGIIAVLITIGYPSLMTALPNMRLKSAARELYSVLQNARMNAVKTNSTWAVVFDTANGAYYLCSDSGADGVWSTWSDNSIEKAVPLSGYGSGVGYGGGAASGAVPGGGIPGDGVSFNNNLVTFSSRGLSSGSGYVYLDNQDNIRSYAVGCLTSGAIRMLTWDSATSTWQ